MNPNSFITINSNCSLILKVFKSSPSPFLEKEGDVLRRVSPLFQRGD
jgi:hypothetical protein